MLTTKIFDMNSLFIKNSLLFLFLLIFTTNIFSQENTKAHTQENLILILNQQLDLSSIQIEKLKLHFSAQEDFLKNSVLSDERMKIVLFAYKRDFEEILTKEQLSRLQRDSNLYQLALNNFNK